MNQETNGLAYQKITGVNPSYPRTAVFCISDDYVIECSISSETTKILLSNRSSYMEKMRADYEHGVPATEAEFNEQLAKAYEAIKLAGGKAKSVEPEAGLLPIEQKANEIPNEIVKAQWFTNWHDDSKCKASKEERNKEFTDSRMTLASVIRNGFTWTLANEDADYWLSISKNINADPTCSFLTEKQETPKQSAVSDKHPILDTAKELIAGDRKQEYGSAQKSFSNIAAKWSVTLGRKIDPREVILCMIDLKTCRFANNLNHLDSAIDIAGYAGLLNEVKGIDNEQ